MSEGVTDNGYVKKIGADKTHLRVSIKTARGLIAGIGFGMGEEIAKIKDCQEFDICYSIKENEWNGAKNLQLILAEIK